MKKSNYQNYMLFFTFLILWMSLQFGQLVSNTMAYIMILSVGIVHGSNDLILLRKSQQHKRSFQNLLLRYLLLIAICIGGFFIHAFLAILLFIIISAYHFGEQHLEKYSFPKSILEEMYYLIYGLLIFLFLFSQNLTEVNAIVYDLSSRTFSFHIVLYGLLFAIGLQLFLFLYLYANRSLSSSNILKEIVYLLIIFFLFRTTSLLLGFAVYFIFWHSIPSILDQIKFLKGAFSKRTAKHYFKDAIPIWCLSLCALIITYIFVKPNFFSSVLFLILFAVTAPHVWVMFLIRKDS